MLIFYVYDHNLSNRMQFFQMINMSITFYRDMPQGDHKKRAKYRFASKTLMRILPDKMKGEVEALINQKAMTLDLYEILGQCTWGKDQGKSL